MVKKFRGLMAAALLVLPALATATPVQYVFDLGPSYDGQVSSGTASFYWDADTRLISNLNWDLGAGRVGSVPDATVNWSGPGIITGTLAEFAFELLTGEDTWAGGACGSTHGCGVGFTLYDGAYPNQLDGWPFLLMGFGLSSTGLAEYNFSLQDNPTQLHRGTRTLATIAPTDVPEPGFLALLGAAAIGFATRKRFRIEASSRAG